jgi:predicted carbohydrate-binding protein with CBM5 and CBM33 domain
LISHYNPENTVSFNLLTRNGTFLAEIEMMYQNTSADGVYITYVFPVPVGLSGDATIQSVFNATHGGGDVYYSCADIAVEAASTTAATTAGSTTGAAASVVASVAVIVSALFALFL